MRVIDVLFPVASTRLPGLGDTGQEEFDDSSREGLVSVESDFRRAVKGGVGRKDGPTSTSKSAGAEPTRVVQLSRNLYQTQADLSEGASLEEAFR